MRATQVTTENLFQNKTRHRPACPGDPISFFQKTKWVPRTSRGMTVFGLEEKGACDLGGPHSRAMTIGVELIPPQSSSAG
jgi:hypothetical protein